MIKRHFEQTCSNNDSPNGTGPNGTYCGPNGIQILKAILLYGVETVTEIGRHSLVCKSISNYISSTLLMSGCPSICNLMYADRIIPIFNRIHVPRPTLLKQRDSMIIYTVNFITDVVSKGISYITLSITHGNIIILSLSIGKFNRFSSAPIQAMENSYMRTRHSIERYDSGALKNIIVNAIYYELDTVRCKVCKKVRKDFKKRTPPLLMCKKCRINIF